MTNDKEKGGDKNKRTIQRNAISLQKRIDILDSLHLIRV